MMNTELKKMNTEELELVAGGGLVVFLADEKVEDSVVNMGFAVKEIPETVGISIPY